jgi:seryl-tRNA synthetase
MTNDQLQTAATMRAAGKSYRDIESVIQVDHSVIHKQFQKDELNQLIKQAQNDLIKNSLATAIQNQSAKIAAGQNIIRQIATGEELTRGAVKLAELAHDSEKQLLQSVGIHPSHTQSIQVNNILIDNRTELSPAVERLLATHLGKVEAEVIDV